MRFRMQEEWGGSSAREKTSVLVHEQVCTRCCSRPLSPELPLTQHGARRRSVRARRRLVAQNLEQIPAALPGRAAGLDRKIPELSQKPAGARAQLPSFALQSSSSGL